MGIVRNIDRRREQRTLRELPLIVWGVDAWGERFLQEARARDISLFGALLSALGADLKSGDVIGILFLKEQSAVSSGMDSLRRGRRQDAGCGASPGIGLVPVAGRTGRSGSDRVCSHCRESRLI